MLKGNLVAYSGMTTKIRAMKNKLVFYRPPLHMEKYLPVWTRHLHTVVRLKAE